MRAAPVTAVRLNSVVDIGFSNLSVGWGLGVLAGPADRAGRAPEWRCNSPTSSCTAPDRRYHGRQAAVAAVRWLMGMPWRMRTAPLATRTGWITVESFPVVRGELALDVNRRSAIRAPCTRLPDRTSIRRAYTQNTYNPVTERRYFALKCPASFRHSCSAAALPVAVPLPRKPLSAQSVIQLSTRAGLQQPQTSGSCAAQVVEGCQLLVAARR